MQQDSFLFAGSLEQNITMDALDVDAERLALAFRASHLDQVKERLAARRDADQADGDAPEILEGGSNLSAGERQLVAMARALAGTQRCCCSTRQPPTSTRDRALADSHDRSGPRGAHCPRHRPPTQRLSPIGSSCWIKAGSWRAVHLLKSSLKVGRTPVPSRITVP